MQQRFRRCVLACVDLCAIRYDVAVRVWLWLLIAWCGLGSTRGAAQIVAAEPTPMLQVVVWLFGESDAQLLLRIQGQTADLPVVLRPDWDDGAVRSPEARLRRATQLAGSQSAVVYRETQPSGGQRLRLLYQGRVFSRELSDRDPPPGDVLRASAIVESAAVILRSALRALLAGESLGDGVDDVLVNRAPDPVSGPAAIGSPALRGFFGALRWQLGVDGISPRAAHALGASGGFVADRWFVQASLLLGIPMLLEDARSVVALSRHQISLAVGWVLISGYRIRLHLAFAGGFCGYLRSTQQVDPAYDATAPALLPALCLSPQLGLWVRPTMRAPLFVDLSLGADLPLGRPRLGYAEGSDFAERSLLWPVQPALSVALLWAQTQGARASRRGQAEAGMAASGQAGLQRANGP